MEKFWFKTAGASFGLCVSLIIADATLSVGSTHYSFWVGPLAVGVYLTTAIGMIGLICGLFGVLSSAWRRVVLGEDALRRIGEISATPGYTGAEKQRLLAPYLRMRMKITGAVVDVSERNGSSSQVTVLTCLPDIIAFMNFRGKAMFDRYLAILSPGMQVTIVGKIKQMEPNGIYLVNCEIVSMN